MSSRALWLLIAGLAWSAAPASAADSFCVSCSAPQASYVCEVTLPEGVVPTQSPQLYCAYRLAAEGQHASCSSRRAGETPCPGDRRQLAYQGPSLVEPPIQPSSDEPLPAESAPAPEESDQGAAEPAAVDAPADADREPKTVVELTEQVKEALADAVQGSDGPGKDETRIGDVPAAEQAQPVEPEAPSTGEKIASAAKTAFNCLTSWFEECE